MSALVLGALTMLSGTPLRPTTPADQPLLISFIVAPVGEPGKAPKLVVAVRNGSEKAIPFMRFESAKCFAHFYLRLSLSGPGGDEPLDTGCPIRSWPGVKGTLEADATERRTLDLAELFPQSKWRAGRYELSAGWDPSELQRSFDGYGWRAESTSGRPGFTLAPLVGKARAERKKEVTFPDGARFTFTAHGHKEVKRGGPESPLIVHGTFTPPKGEAEEVDVRVHTGEGSVMRIGERVFVVGAYEYDSFMDLSYFGKLPGAD